MTSPRAETRRLDAGDRGRDDHPDRAARRAADRHRGDARRAQRERRRLGAGRLAGRDRAAGRHQSLPRAPAVQGHDDALGARHRERDGRRRRRVQRVHREGTHLLLRDRARPRPAARGRHRRRRRPQCHDHGAGRRRRARRRARRDRDARRRPGRSRPRRVLRGAVRDGSARPADPRHRGLDPGADPPPDPRLLPPPLHAGRDGGVGRRQRRRTPTSCGWSAARSATGSTRRCATSPPRPAGRRPFADAGRSRSRCVPDDTEQANLVLGCHGMSRHDPRRFALGVLSVRARRRDELAAVPAGPRGARARVLGVLVQQRLRRRRPVRRLRRLPAGQGRRGARADDRRTRRRRGRRAHRRRGRARQGPDARRDGARPRGRRLADDPDRQERGRVTATSSAWTRCWPGSTR